jgi:hypothetical protein
VVIKQEMKIETGEYKTVPTVSAVSALPNKKVLHWIDETGEINETDEIDSIHI